MVCAKRPSALALPAPAAGQAGSIIILVMVTLLFTSAALVAFLDRAGTDLMVDARSAQAARMRPDAYSALEVTLAVLQDFRRAVVGIRQCIFGNCHTHGTPFSRRIGAAATR